MFKKKSEGKASSSKRKLKLNSSEYNLKINVPFLNNSRNKKGEILYAKDKSNRKATSKSKERIKNDKTINKLKEKGKGARLKTEPDTNVIGTIRAKLIKRN